MRKLLILSALIAFVFVAYAEYIPVGMDARAYSMGNAVATGSVGPASILRNPSGIGWMETGAISLTGKLVVLGSMGFEDDVYEDQGLEDHTMAEQMNAKIPGVAFATPLPIDAPFDLVGGIAWGQFFDFSGKVKETYTVSSTNTEYENINTNKGGFNLLTPAIAARFAGNYVVGLSYGFAFLSNANSSGTGETSNPSSESEYEMTRKVTGSMLQLSAQGKFLDKLTVGFSFAPAFKMEYEDIEYDDGTNSYDIDDVKYEFPAYMAFGASFDVTQDVTILGEYQNRPYDDTEVENVDSGIENGSSIRLGVEYRGPVALRAGFFTDKIMTPAEPGEDEPAGAMGITAGLGVAVGPVGLDLGAFYQSAKWESNTGMGTGNDEDFSTNLVGIAVTATYELDVFGK
ncbi:hypothetical protein KAH81_04950 [bacterium]|nr:hypothetical protein [bacterium]